MNNRMWAWKWSLFHPLLQAVTATSRRQNKRSWWPTPPNCSAEGCQSQWLNFGIETCLLCNHPGSKRITWTKELNLSRRIHTHTPMGLLTKWKVQRHFCNELQHGPVYWELSHVPKLRFTYFPQQVRTKSKSLSMTDAWNASAGGTSGLLIISAWELSESLCCPEMLYWFPVQRYLSSF